MSSSAALRIGTSTYRGSINPTEWTVGDFKSVEYATLPLKRLTVLTGANSSGKSSLIQSLLLLGQSSQDEIVLNGILVRLGQPEDVIRSGSGRVTMAYSATSTDPESDAVVNWDISLKLGLSGTVLEVQEFDAAADGEHVLSATSSRVTAVTKREVNPDGKYGGTVLRVSEVYGRRPPSRTYLAFSGFHPEAFIVRRDKGKVLADLRRNYGKRVMEQDVERLFDLYDYLQPWWRFNQEKMPQEIVEAYGNLFRSGYPARYLNDPELAGLDKLFEVYAESTAAEGWQAIPLPRRGRPYRTTVHGARFLGISDRFRAAMIGLTVADEVIDLLRSSLRYLGPLREEPQVVSASGGRGPNTPAGIRGEYTADLLNREKNRRVQFRDWTGSLRTEKLPEAVSVWTSYLGVGDDVTVEDQGKLGRGLRLHVHGVERDLTTVGVGASQLLPVIAIVLSATPGAIVCIEQPELHLHPAVQSRLADFFLHARPDVALIIETHSEYMITRIRRRAAERSIEADDVSIFFAEQDAKGTNFRNLKLGADGNLSDWPEGFFDAQDEDARALVAAIARATQEV